MGDYALSEDIVVLGGLATKSIFAWTYLFLPLAYYSCGQQKFRARPAGSRDPRRSAGARRRRSRSFRRARSGLLRTCAEIFLPCPGKPRPVASQGTEGIEHGAGRGSQPMNLHRFWPWRGRVTAPVQTPSMARIGVASLWATARATRPRSGTGRCRRGTAQSNAVPLALMIGRASGEPSCKICFV